MGTTTSKVTSEDETSLVTPIIKLKIKECAKTESTARGSSETTEKVKKTEVREVVSIDDFWSGTILMLAATYGSKKDVEEILEAKADINIADTDGKTALSRAILYEKHDIIELLLKKGANVKVKVGRNDDTEQKFAKEYCEAKSSDEADWQSTKDLINFYSAEPEIKEAFERAKSTPTNKILRGKELIKILTELSHFKDNEEFKEYFKPIEFKEYFKSIESDVIKTFFEEPAYKNAKGGIQGTRYSSKQTSLEAKDSLDNTALHKAVEVGSDVITAYILCSLRPYEGMTIIEQIQQKNKAEKNAQELAKEGNKKTIENTLDKLIEQIKYHETVDKKSGDTFNYANITATECEGIIKAFFSKPQETVQAGVSTEVAANCADVTTDTTCKDTTQETVQAGVSSEAVADVV